LLANTISRAIPMNLLTMTCASPFAIILNRKIKSCKYFVERKINHTNGNFQELQFGLRESGKEGEPLSCLYSFVYSICCDDEEMPLERRNIQRNSYLCKQLKGERDLARVRGGTSEGGLG
jgi:hypothetical protein